MVSCTSSSKLKLLLGLLLDMFDATSAMMVGLVWCNTAVNYVQQVVATSIEYFCNYICMYHIYIDIPYVQKVTETTVGIIVTKNWFQNFFQFFMVEKNPLKVCKAFTLFLGDNIVKTSKIKLFFDFNFILLKSTFILVEKYIKEFKSGVLRCCGLQYQIYK